MIEQWIERGKEVIMNTYNSFPIVLEQGKGAYVWDVEGKQYLDFVAGIAVNCLGYQNKSYMDNLHKQMEKLMHCSNLYWNKPSIETAEILVKNSCFDKVFFCNSGAEAVEAALKLSRKYGKKKKGNGCSEIITMKQSFHGRTLGAITATGQEKYQKHLTPLLPGIQYSTYNDFESLKDLVSENTCAIMIEPIQGEGGIHPAEKEFLAKTRELCNQMNILLIFDEVQTGIGRSGKLFAYEVYGIEPDVIALAKGLGGGFPIGAMMAKNDAAAAFEPGDHASTYGGNPMATIAANTVLTELIENKLLKNVEKQGLYLQEKLIALQEKYDGIIDVRGVGLMQGIELNIPVAPIINICIDKGLLLVGAGSHVIRFVPPLIIGKYEIDAAMDILEEALQEL